MRRASRSAASGVRGAPEGPGERGVALAARRPCAGEHLVRKRHRATRRTTSSGMGAPNGERELTVDERDFAPHRRNRTHPRTPRASSRLLSSAAWPRSDHGSARYAGSPPCTCRPGPHDGSGAEPVEYGPATALPCCPTRPAQRRFTAVSAAHHARPSHGEVLPVRPNAVKHATPAGAKVEDGEEAAVSAGAAALRAEARGLLPVAARLGAPQSGRSREVPCPALGNHGAAGGPSARVGPDHRGAHVYGEAAVRALSDGDAQPGPRLSAGPSTAFFSRWGPAWEPTLARSIAAWADSVARRGRRPAMAWSNRSSPSRTRRSAGTAPAPERLRLQYEGVMRRPNSATSGGRSRGGGRRPAARAAAPRTVSTCRTRPAPCGRGDPRRPSAGAAGERRRAAP